MAPMGPGSAVTSACGRASLGARADSTSALAPASPQSAPRHAGTCRWPQGRAAQVCSTRACVPAAAHNTLTPCSMGPCARPVHSTVKHASGISSSLQPQSVPRVQHYNVAAFMRSSTSGSTGATSGPSNSDYAGSTDGVDVVALKSSLLQIISKLNAVSNPSPADVREFETCVVSLAAANPTAVPEASSLLDGRWALLYTSKAPVQLQRALCLTGSTGSPTDSLLAPLQAMSDSLYQLLYDRLPVLAGSATVVKGSIQGMQRDGQPLLRSRGNFQVFDLSGGRVTNEARFEAMGREYCITVVGAAKVVPSPAGQALCQPPAKRTGSTLHPAAAAIDHSMAGSMLQNATGTATSSVASSASDSDALVRPSSLRLWAQFKSFSVCVDGKKLLELPLGLPLWPTPLNPSSNGSKSSSSRHNRGITGTGSSSAAAAESSTPQLWNVAGGPVGYVYTVYLDSQLRISVGDKGSVFVAVKK